MKKRIADIVADALAAHGITQVFSLVGGGAMFLNDAFGHHPKLNVVYTQHEQACSMAAEGYVRTGGRMAAVCVTTGLGGLTYPLEGVCNIRFLHKIRIFQGFRVKTKLFSVTYADFTASPERVAPRRVPKMAPFIRNRTKLLFRRRVARVFFCFYDYNIINQKRFSKYPLESEFIFKIVLTIRHTLAIIDNTKISALAVNQIEFRKDCELCTMSNIIRAYLISTAA